MVNPPDTEAGETLDILFVMISTLSLLVAQAVALRSVV